MTRLVGVVVVASLLCAGNAVAEVKDTSRAAARELGYAGVESFNAGKYEVAYAKLDKAYQVLQVPSLALWSGRALIKLNRWVEAAERLRQAPRLPAQGGDAAVQEQAQRDAQTEYDQLTARMPKVVIRTKGVENAEVQIEIDGESITSALIGEPLPANPGPHAIVGRHAGREVTVNVTAVESKVEKVTLRFEAEPVEAAPVTPTSEAVAPEPDRGSPGPTRPLLGWVLVGAGAAGVALGATTGFIAMGKKSDLEDSAECREQRCLFSKRSDVDSYDTFRTVSGVGLIAGAALAAVGVVVLVTAKPPANTPAASAQGRNVWLSVTPTSGHLAGTF